MNDLFSEKAVVEDEQIETLLNECIHFENICVRVQQYFEPQEAKLSVERQECQLVVFLHQNDHMHLLLQVSEKHKNGFSFWTIIHCRTGGFLSLPMRSFADVKKFRVNFAKYLDESLSEFLKRVACV